MVLGLVLSALVQASDSEPATIQWSLFGSNDSRVFASDNDAVRMGCEKLRKAPPSSVNSVNKVTLCGDSISPTASARNYRVSYTLQSDDRSLNHQTTTSSSFMIQRKAYCPSAGFPFLREDDSSRFQFSCWRCPVAELRQQAPQFVSDQIVRWYRNSQCPMDFDQQRSEDGQALVPFKKKANGKLPIGVELSAADEVSFRILRDAPYGRVAELQYESGERVFFIGDATPGASLLPAKPEQGSLTEAGNRWIWTAADKTEYRFGATNNGHSRVISKTSRDGKQWQFVWQTPANNASVAAVSSSSARLETMIDPNNQQYQYRYDRQGKLTGIIMQTASRRDRIAKD